MKKNMITATAAFLLAAVIFKITYDVTGIPACYSMMVTFGTLFYHFGMRLAVGSIINAKFHICAAGVFHLGRRCSSFLDYILHGMSSGFCICDCAEIQPSTFAPPKVHPIVQT